MQRLCKILISVVLLSVLPASKPDTAGKPSDDAKVHDLWLGCRVDKVIPFGIFKTAMIGYTQTAKRRKKNILTIVDFSKPSISERFFVIDIDKKMLRFHSLVAHGRNSGDNFATIFSNTPESLESSLGFYLTAETYSGNHGYSLRLDGLEKNFNDNARMREIVIHGADYVSQEFIKKYGRLGRSWGCPALPLEISKEVIDTISNGSCLFIYADNKNYFAKSSFLNTQ